MQERAAEALRSGALQTYKQQISFGLHVVVMMGTFFAVGYVAGTALSPKLAVVCSIKSLHKMHCLAQNMQMHMQTVFCCAMQRSACGLCGLVLAMLLETVLLMLESTRFETPRASTKASAVPSDGKKQQ